MGFDQAAELRLQVDRASIHQREQSTGGVVLDGFLRAIGEVEAVFVVVGGILGDAVGQIDVGAVGVLGGIGVRVCVVIGNISAIDFEREFAQDDFDASLLGQCCHGLKVGLWCCKVAKAKRCNAVGAVGQDDVRRLVGCKNAWESCECIVGVFTGRVRIFV